MSTSDVRNIDALKRFRSGLFVLSDKWNATTAEIRLFTHRVNEYFGTTVPAYWKNQTTIAERLLNEAHDALQQKQGAARAADRTSASEAQKRVRLAKERLRLCRQRQQAAKAIAIDMAQRCDDLLAPLADVAEHSDNYLPAAAEQLGTLIEMLLRYADASGLTPASDSRQQNESTSNQDESSE